jgi:hypothetical protein
MRYLGEGDISKERIIEDISKNNLIIYGSKNDDYYKPIIKEALELMNKRMSWRTTFYNRSKDPLVNILKDKVKAFYDTFDNLRRSKIDIYLAGDRYNNPFIIYIDKYNYVAGVPSKSSLFIGHGLFEAWYADPRVYLIDGRGYKAFYTLFQSSIAYLIALFIGLDRSSAKEVQMIFDKDKILDKNLQEAVMLIENDRYPISSNIQRKASIALRGYLNAWFEFMKDSSWLEIHHTLIDSKVVEKEQTFLDTATTEISETSRGIILDTSINIFSADEMERRDRERKEKEMDWTLLRIALGILYKREKEYLEKLWNKKKRRMAWRELQETYYEEIWDMIRMHLSGENIELIMDNKELRDLGKWHFIFDSKRSERSREKVVTLEKMGIEQLFERKNILLNMLEYEGVGLPPDAQWNDVINRFRKIMIRYHPDRVEITKIDIDLAREVTSKAINIFRELEIIHDLKPEIFGIAKLPEDYIKEK